MTRLSDIQKACECYIAIHGDKEVTGLGTCIGASGHDYEICVHDLYNGPVGSNPFTGRDSIRLPLRTVNTST